MLGPIAVRRYRPGEEALLWQLCRDTTRRINGKDYTPAQVEKWAPQHIDQQKWQDRMRAKNPFVAETDGTLLGFAELAPGGYVSGFYTHHGWQRMGIGTALYLALEAAASQAGIETLHVEASKSATAFFSRMGFAISRVREFHDCNAPVKNFVMIKKLHETQTD